MTPAKRKQIYNVPVAGRRQCDECGMPGADFTPSVPDRALCLTCIQRARADCAATDEVTESLYGFDDPEEDPR